MRILFVLCLLSSSPAWAGSFDHFADATYRTVENTLTLKIVPPETPIQWHQPRALLLSLAKGMVFDKDPDLLLGHVAMELNCGTGAGRVRASIGQSVKDLNGFYSYLWQGYGFSLLNRPGEHPDLPLVMVEGELDNDAADEALFSRLGETRRLGVLSFQIPETACRNALSFVREYELHTAGGPAAGHRYGFGADPALFQGAGCASLAETLLQKAGLASAARLFERTIWVAPGLAGNPPEGRPTHAWDLAWNSEDLNQAGPKRLRFDFPDPQLMFEEMNRWKAGGGPAVKLLAQPDFPVAAVLLGPSALPN